MRFVQFCNKSGLQRLGVQVKLGGDIVDLNAANSRIPDSLIQLLRGGKELISLVKPIVENAKTLVPLSEVKLLAPITQPDKIACVGLNYKGHCEENNLSIPKDPIIFSKFSSCIVGPYDDIKYPSVSDVSLGIDKNEATYSIIYYLLCIPVLGYNQKVDWEVELAVIIGEKGYNIPQDKALDHVFGFTVAQDVSARDWQKTLNGGQFLLGKSMDTFCPLGPAVLTKESVKDVYNLNIKSLVNGVVKQNANTSEIIHKIDAVIARISSCVTLYPGDIILTGTPGGVGMVRNPPEFLKVGDVVTSEIDQIGKMENKIVRA